MDKKFLCPKGPPLCEKNIVIATYAGMESSGPKITFSELPDGRDNPATACELDLSPSCPTKSSPWVRAALYVQKNISNPLPRLKVPEMTAIKTYR